MFDFQNPLTASQEFDFHVFVQLGVSMNQLDCSGAKGSQGARVISKSIPNPKSRQKQSVIESHFDSLCSTSLGLGKSNISQKPP